MRSQKIFEKACELMPGGVNSPVRAYRAVGMCIRDRAGRADPNRSPFHGNDAYGQFGYRGGDECHPCCKRLYRQGLYCKI